MVVEFNSGKPFFHTQWGLANGLFHGFILNFEAPIPKTLESRWFGFSRTSVYLITSEDEPFRN
jgi:hypothetical protein